MTQRASSSGHVRPLADVLKGLGQVLRDTSELGRSVEEYLAVSPDHPNWEGFRRSKLQQLDRLVQRIDDAAATVEVLNLQVPSNQPVNTDDLTAVIKLREILVHFAPTLSCGKTAEPGAVDLF